MASPSYHKLARYDDFSRNSRARCTGDIRQSQRENLSRSRLRMRYYTTLTNRKTLFEHFKYSSDEHTFEPIQLSGVDCVDGHPQGDDSRLSFESDACNWGSPGGMAPRSGAISPSESIYSERSSPYSINDSYQDQDIIETSPIEHMLREISSDRQTARKNIPKSRRQRLEQRKQANVNSSDSSRISEQFRTISQLICECQHCPGAVNSLVRFRWRAIADALRSYEAQLASEAVDFMQQLVYESVICTQTIMVILQEGFIFSLKGILSGNSPIHRGVIDLLSLIARTDDRTIPYLVELMSNTGILNLLDDIYNMGTIEEVCSVTRLYFQLSQTITIQLCTGAVPEPYIPNVFSGANLDEVRQSYSPIVTLKRLMGSNFVRQVVSKLRYQFDMIDPNTLRMSLAILSVCIRIIHEDLSSTSLDLDWIQAQLRPLRQRSFEQLLSMLVTRDETRGFRDDMNQFVQLFRNFSEKVECMLPQDAVDTSAQNDQGW